MATCYADPTLAEKELGWKTERTLDEMCKSLLCFKTVVTPVVFRGHCNSSKFELKKRILDSGNMAATVFNPILLFSAALFPLASNDCNQNTSFPNRLMIWPAKNVVVAILSGNTSLCLMLLQLPSEVK